MLTLRHPDWPGARPCTLFAEGQSDMSAKSGKSGGGNFRSAESGRFVTPRFAGTHPKTTVHEAPPKKK